MLQVFFKEVLMILTFYSFREFVLRKIQNGFYNFCSRKRKQGEKVNTEVNMRRFAEHMSMKKVTKENGENRERVKEIPKVKKRSDVIEAKRNNKNLPDIE